MRFPEEHRSLVELIEELGEAIPLYRLGLSESLDHRAGLLALRGRLLSLANL
jgi:hypothetical protein